jgi:predicted ATPase
MHPISCTFLGRCFAWVISIKRLWRDEALAEARRVSPYNVAYALCLAWYCTRLIEGMRSALAMLPVADEVIAVSGEKGFPLWLAVGNIMRGWCLGAAGQPTKGIPLLLRGVGGFRTIGAKVMMPFFLTTLAELYGISGQPEEGLTGLAEAAKLVESTQERWTDAEMHRVRGVLLASLREEVGAQTSFRQAIDVAQNQNAKFWELRAALDLARLWRDQGKRTEARDLLAPVYNWFTEGFDTPVLQDAKALLDQLE